MLELRERDERGESEPVEEQRGVHEVGFDGGVDIVMGVEMVTQLCVYLGIVSAEQIRLAARYQTVYG